MQRGQNRWELTVLVLLKDTEQKRNCCRQEPEKLQKQWKRLRRFWNKSEDVLSIIKVMRVFL